LPSSSAGLVSRALAVYAKDFRLELRSRYALNAILMFGITTLVVVSYSVGQLGLGAGMHAALFWIIVFFSAMSGLSQVFVREEESGTAMALRLTAEPEAVFIGKLVYNLSLLTLLVAMLCGATTIVAAIIARAAVRGTLFAVLSFPILMPLLLVLVAATTSSMEGEPISEIATELQFLAAYPVVMITGSVLLFRFVWND